MGINQKLTNTALRTAGKSVSFAVDPQPQRTAGKSAWAQGPPLGSLKSGASTHTQAAATPTAGQSGSKYTPPHIRNGNQSTASSGNQVAGLMQGLKIGGGVSQNSLKIQDPSVAPVASVAPSMMTTFKPYAGSRFSTPRADENDRRRKWIKNAVCKKSPWVRSTFQKGHVISLPFHVPNMNERCDPNDKGLTVNQNFDGGIFTKRRMMVVLFKHAELMYCLPLYSFSGRGIASRRAEVAHEYVQLMDRKHEGYFDIMGQHNPVEFRHRSFDNSLSTDTVIHLTGGLSVNWEEDISKVGRITEESYRALLTVWHQLNDAAETETADWGVDL